jgi:hypothetical protein
MEMILPGLIANFGDGGDFQFSNGLLVTVYLA